jgi:predicted transcriptional regulator
MITTREELHRLVDELLEETLNEAARALQGVRIPKRRPTVEEIFANAPVDDESLTDAEHAAIAEGRDDVAAGRLISNEEIRREFGLRGNTRRRSGQSPGRA